MNWIGTDSDFLVATCFVTITFLNCLALKVYSQVKISFTKLKTFRMLELSAVQEVSQPSSK